MINFVEEIDSQEIFDGGSIDFEQVITHENINVFHLDVRDVDVHGDQLIGLRPFILIFVLLNDNF